MFRFHSRTVLIVACGLAVFVPSAARASVSTADIVLAYATDEGPSSYWGEPYSDHLFTAPLGLPDAAINLPENDGAGIYPDDSYVTPFNGQYDPTNIAAISGPDGFIELQLSEPISTNGFTLGVHTGSALADSAYPSGTNYSSASTYTDTRTATLSVSDGNTWVTVGTFDFDNPTNIYDDIAGPYADTAGTTLADFGQPFLGNLSTFNGLDFADTIAAFDGSAGGTWIDLSHTGLADVTQVAFATAAGQTMFLDSVVGIPVPEPASVAVLVLPIFFRRRR